MNYTIPRGTACFAATILLLSALAGASGAEAPFRSLEASILGYGHLVAKSRTIATGASVTVFRCQDAVHADRLLDKLRADNAWDRMTGPKSDSLAGGVPILVTAGGSALVFARTGATVYAIVAPSVQTARAALSALGLRPSTAAFEAKKPRPAMLDYYDLRPLSMNFVPMLPRGQKIDGPFENSFLKAELEKAHAFWEPYGIDLNYLDFCESWGFGQPLPGEFNTFAIDYTTKLARAHGQNISFMFGNTPSPWWVRNLYPDQISETDPNVLPSSMGISGAAWLSMWASDEAFAHVHDFDKRMLALIQKDAGDRLTMIRPIAGGRQGDELTLHAAGSEYLGYDERAQDAFRRWLRDGRKLSLTDLAQRWYGDPAHFKSWSQVAIPSEYDFFGGYDDPSQTLPLLTGWKWRPDRKASDNEGWGDADYAPGPEWLDIDLAPSYRQFLLRNSQPDDKTERAGKTAWFRKEFNLTDYLAQHKGKSVYLVVSTRMDANVPVEIWVNGTYIGGIRPHEVYMGPVAAEITSLVHTGRNVVCVKVLDGIIPGPVFVTTHTPRRYPYLGPCENARFVDMREWKGSEQLVQSWMREALPARQQAPESPLCLAPGGYLYTDRFGEMKARGGLTQIHETGGFAGSYSPELSGLAYVQGLNFTNEEGDTNTDAFWQTRQLAWFLFEGVSHHDYVQHAQDYMEWEKQAGWFKKHERLLSLVAKSVRARPAIAILMTPEVTWRYFPYSAGSVSWDIGRGALQAAHENNAYVTGAEVISGAVDQFPVLIDSNTTVMSPELLAGIERYVRAGGTFVALQGTGRSTLIDADTWPISRLTGFNVVGEKPEQMVTILKDNTLLRRMAGMKLPGTGLVLNWMGQNLAKESLPVALAAGSGDCIPLAKWEDGSIAAGMRMLGKGRVIVLGSTFWASKSDLAGNGYGLNGSVQTNFLSDLCDGLGVRRDVDCAATDVWARRAETKNGLQDWMVLWNSSTAPVADAGLSFSFPVKPTRVLDEETGASLPFTYAGGNVNVTKLPLDSNGIRVIGVDRSDLNWAALHWFGVKATYETATREPVAPPSFTPPTQVVTQIDNYQFRQIDEADASSGSWLTAKDNAAPWKGIGPGFWDEQGFEAQGIGAYRTKITIPAAWNGQQIILAGMSNWVIFLGKPEAFVNGQDAGSAFVYPFDPAATQLDITALVHPGVNDLAFLVRQNVARGGYLGGMCLYAQPYLTKSRKLTTWNVFVDERSSSPTDIPIRTKARFLQASVDIPATWDAQHVYLEFDQGNQRWLRYIMVNDRPLNYTWYEHLFPNKMRINLAPYVKPGEANRIEFWSDPHNATSPMTLQSAAIGTIL